MAKTVFNVFTGLPDYVGASTGTGGGAFPGIVLMDSNGFYWTITIDTTGHLITTLVSSPPSGYYYPNHFVLQDSTAANWTVTINTSGHLITASGGANASVIETMIINDSTGRSWLVSIDTSGHLVTA
jgi:hypothetical protein